MELLTPLMPENMPWVWFIIAVVLIIIEGLTFTLLTVWFAIAALILTILSFLPIPLIPQILIFLVISIVLLLLTRPIMLKKLKTKREKTNVDRFIGMIGVVTRKITSLEKGEIKVGGAFWTAMIEKGESLEEGNKCRIVRIEGVTAIVEPNFTS